MIKAALLASGQGSNAKALLEKETTLDDVSIELVITDNPHAGVIDIANKFNKPCFIYPRGNSSKNQHETLILETLHNFEIDWVLLAGYMRLLSKDFIKSFYCPNLQQSKILNIHPSLLPLHPGLNAYEKTFKHTPKQAGVTIHYVDSGMDTGKILIQEKFESLSENFEEFKQEGLKLEHRLYTKVLSQLSSIAKEGHI